MDVAQRLKALVAEKGVTYTFISERTGIPIDSISRSFLGKRKLPADELVAICRVVGVDLGDFTKAAIRADT